MRRWLFVFAVLLTLAGCRNTNTTADDALEGPLWTVTMFSERAPNFVFTVRFDNGELRGQAACAPYEGSYSAGRGDRLIIERVVIEDTECPSADFPSDKAAFSQALQQVTGFTRDGTDLILTGLNGEPVLTLTSDIEK